MNDDGKGKCRPDCAPESRRLSQCQRVVEGCGRLPRSVFCTRVDISGPLTNKRTHAIMVLDACERVSDEAILIRNGMDPCIRTNVHNIEADVPNVLFKFLSVAP
jgi:hypothetical protein